ncbi:MAG: hypothetical protein AB7N76_10225 [Planctomycetota bacterium]
MLVSVVTCPFDPARGGFDPEPLHVHFQRQLNAIGQQLGGWRKACARRSGAPERPR